MLGNATDKTYAATNTVTQYSESLTVEVNQNYYYSILPVDETVYGTSEPGFYKRYFPLDSVVAGWRPPAGMYRPRRTTWDRAYQYGLRGSKGYRNQIEGGIGTSTGEAGAFYLKPRCYYPSDIHAFKYWDSPVPVSSSAYVHPYVEYSASLYCNKISVTFQTAMGRPSAFKIQYKTTAGSGGTWVDALAAGVAGDINPVTGAVSVWRQSGSWTTAPTTYNISDCIQIRQIRVLITAMTDPVTHPSIIEISPRIEVDLSDRMKSWSWDGNISEDGGALPVGTASSNNGSLVLSNNDGLLDPENAGIGSPTVADLMRKYSKVTVKRKGAGGGTSWTEGFVAYIDTAIPSGNKSLVNVTIFDRAKFLQETEAPDISLQQVTPEAAIWSMLDYTGFGNVIIKKKPGQSTKVLRYFWSNNEQTVWEAIQEICASYQYAVYISEKDEIVIMSPEYMFDTRTAAWALTTEQYTYSGTAYKPNVIDVNNEVTDVSNVATVTFRPISMSSDTDPDEKMAARSKNQVAFNRLTTLELYRPNSAVMVGCARMTYTINSTQNYVYIDSTSLRNADWGSFSGYALIDSEIIKYEGLEFAYTPKAGAGGITVAKNIEEYNEIVSSANGVVTFTGKLCNVSRGQFGTTAAAHNLSTTGWTNTGGVSRKPDSLGNSWLCIRNTVAGNKRLSFAAKSLQTNGNWTNTRMLIEDIKTRRQAGGIAVSAHLSGGTMTSGIYVEFDQADTLKSGGVAVYAVANSIIGAAPITSRNFTVSDGKPMDVSVYFARGSSSTQRVIKVYINRSLVLSHTFNTSITMTNVIALGASGDSSVKFDYVCGGNSLISGEQSAYDGELRRYIQSVLELNRGQSRTRSIPSLASIGFERFDDYIREIYFDEVSFARRPAASVNFVGTSLTVRDALNRQEVALGNEIATAISNITPSGATVLVANVSSRPLILANVMDDGENLYPFIYGYVINEFEPVKVEKRNESSITRFGEKKVEISHKWISSRVNAEHIANLIITRKADGERKLKINAWNAHLVQLGDIVYVHVPDKNIDANYLVTSISKAGGGEMTSDIELVKI